MVIDWVKMEEMGNIILKNILHLFHSQSRGADLISRLVVPLEPTNDQRLLIWDCENWNHMICGGTLGFFPCWKCSNMLFRNPCAQFLRGGTWNTRGKLRARSHFLASNFLVIILTMKNNILQAVFLFEVVFYITETMMNSFSTAGALVVVAV